MPPGNPKSNIKDINKALLRIKQFVSSANFSFCDSRKKNMETLAYFGITIKNIIDIILELTYKNYCNGPSNDRDFPEDINTIWEFGYELDGQEIYIKIKIARNDKVILISFHKAERLLHFHYK